MAELRDGDITCYQLTPEDFGLPYHSKESLAGGTEENRDILAQLLRGKGERAHSMRWPSMAMLLKIFGNEDLRDNAQRALSAIASGQAYERVVALAARG